MNGATLQGKIYRGYAMTAAKIGLSYAQYRPTNPLAPLATQFGTVLAHFRVDDKFAKPNVYGKPLWLGYFDGRLTQPGDYMVGPQGTLFVAAQQALLPILLVECNRVITISRVAAPSAVGALGYNADVPNTETPYMIGWPTSILAGPKGEQNEVDLPGDIKQPWWAGLLPAWPGLTISAYDIVTDDLGRRYIVSSCELTDLGWRLTLQQAVT